MGVGEILNRFINGGIPEKNNIAPIDTVESGDGNIDDLTSIARYKSSVKQNRGDIDRIRGYVKKYIDEFEQVKKNFPEGSKEYNTARDLMYKWISILDEIELKKGFYRPNTEEDIAHRKRIMTEFPEQLKNALSPNLDLRFHATSIYSAEQIIESKTITSIPDRYDGYFRNAHGFGVISVSGRDSILRIIKQFSGLDAYKECLPAGCIFALFPKDKEDAKKINCGEMGSIDFQKHPEQLFGIVTTPENIKRVKQWMEKAELNPDLVYTHEAFLDVVKLKSKIEDGRAGFNVRIAQTDGDGPIIYKGENGEILVNPDTDLYPDME